MPLLRIPESTTVALVGMDPDDQASLRHILGCIDCLRTPPCRFDSHFEGSAQSLLAALHRRPVAIVFWNRDRYPDAWKDVLVSTAALARPPLVIVASRLADDRLWAEALNLGAYDVLSKPFDPAELSRVAGLACEHWRQRPTPAPAPTPKYLVA